MKEKIEKTRILSDEECKISKKLPPEIRKQFYARLMAGENLQDIKPWLDDANAKYDAEVDKLEEILEALTVCQKQKLPNLSMLSQALQVSKVADNKTYERQIKLVIPIFYQTQPEEYAMEFKKISYKFLDEMAGKVRLFNGNMLDFILFGDYFSVPSGVLLAKHSDLLIKNSMQSMCYAKLGGMLFTLAQKDGLDIRVPEDIAEYLFDVSLKRALTKEEISMLNIFSLMETYSYNIHPSTTPSKSKAARYSKDIEAAIAYCEKHGYMDYTIWQQSLTLTDCAPIWDRQVTLITKYLMRQKLNHYSKEKVIAYRFIKESFAHGFVSSEIIDFIFDGTTFSNSSTVILAMFAQELKNHNLAYYIQEKLRNMMGYLLKQEMINVSTDNVANFLLDTSLVRGMYREEISILNTYVLLQAFNH